ncbi:hypothetical protein RDI58_022356 [Solanum bulbocastanum]|uniref:Uncharacterized protein n=1 Tax=Solanum bulbocastanum TaxID=147425 RepID=A0AAN8T7C8_SOLBU
MMEAIEKAEIQSTTNKEIDDRSQSVCHEGRPFYIRTSIKTSSRAYLNKPMDLEEDEVRACMVETNNWLLANKDKEILGMDQTVMFT